jgi:hypothetical protein
MVDSQAGQEQLLCCEVCLNEIPISEANSEEATEYIMYFYGLECYVQWIEQEKQETS